MKYYRLLSMLPPLPAAPEAPPISLEKIVELLMEDMSQQDRPLALAMLGFLDCRNVEAQLQGFDVFDERAPISKTRLDDREDLPEYLETFLADHDSGSLSEEYPYDALWRAYFMDLYQIAERTRSSFLHDWANFEIQLRDALVKFRAEALEVRADAYMTGVPAEEADHFGPLLTTLADASDPMERERLLDAERLKKIEAISGTDPFSVDAALAYLAAILILDRWDVGKPADVAKMLEVFA